MKKLLLILAIVIGCTALAAANNNTQKESNWTFYETDATVTGELKVLSTQKFMNVDLESSSMIMTCSESLSYYPQIGIIFDKTIEIEPTKSDYYGNGITFASVLVKMQHDKTPRLAEIVYEDQTKIIFFRDGIHPLEMIYNDTFELTLFTKSGKKVYQYDTSDNGHSKDDFLLLCDRAGGR